jgi:MiaB/RimO family radical SAM methylthiotransferase
MINEGVRNDAREIQLTSMDLGAYGIDLRTNLTTLLDSISNDNSSTSAPDKEFLIRLGMINPDHAKRMLSGIVHVLANPKFYKFLHIPVQTGSEKVCREMNRDHTVQDFVDIVTTIRRAVPDTTIATDIIVGYPTETEDDFQHTLKLLQNTKPETVNLSKFSPRPGTNAKELKQLPNDEIKRRSEVASVLVRRIAEEQRKKYIGKQFRVLITERDKNPKRKSVDFKGRTINYTQVVVKSFNGKLGDFLDVEIIDANHGSLFGVPVD